jgi:hypothetical protein
MNETPAPRPRGGVFGNKGNKAARGIVENRGNTSPRHLLDVPLEKAQEGVRVYNHIARNDTSLPEAYGHLNSMESHLNQLKTTLTQHYGPEVAAHVQPALDSVAHANLKHDQMLHKHALPHVSAAQEQSFNVHAAVSGYGDVPEHILSHLNNAYNSSLDYHEAMNPSGLAPYRPGKDPNTGSTIVSSDFRKKVDQKFAKKLQYKANEKAAKAAKKEEE